MCTFYTKHKRTSKTIVPEILENVLNKSKKNRVISKIRSRLRPKPGPVRFDPPNTR